MAKIKTGYSDDEQEILITADGIELLRLTAIQAHSLGEDLLRKAHVVAGHEITVDDFFQPPSQFKVVIGK